MTSRTMAGVSRPHVAVIGGGVVLEQAQAAGRPPREIRPRESSRALPTH